MLAPRQPGSNEKKHIGGCVFISPNARSPQLIAAEAYRAVETSIGQSPIRDAVLVSVDSLAALRRAYPNYFLDTTAFLATVYEALEG